MDELDRQQTASARRPTTRYFAPVFDQANDASQLAVNRTHRQPAHYGRPLTGDEYSAAMASPNIVRSVPRVLLRATGAHDHAAAPPSLDLVHEEDETTEEHFPPRRASSHVLDDDTFVYDAIAQGPTGRAARRSLSHTAKKIQVKHDEDDDENDVGASHAKKTTKRASGAASTCCG